MSFADVKVSVTARTGAIDEEERRTALTDSIDSEKGRIAGAVAYII